MKTRKPYIDYEDYLLPKLRNPVEAATYLNAAFEEDDVELLLIAVYDVARAYGLTALAKRADLHRVSLHKMLRKGGNPELRSFLRLLTATGLQLSFRPKASPKGRKAA